MQRYTLSVMVLHTVCTGLQFNIQQFSNSNLTQMLIGWAPVLTASRSRPFLSRFFTIDDRLPDFHLGKVFLQSGRLSTSGHTSLFGVPRVLEGTEHLVQGVNSLQLSVAHWSDTDAAVGQRFSFLFVFFQPRTLYKTEDILGTPSGMSLGIIII